MSDWNLLNGYMGSKTPYSNKIKSLFDAECTKYVEGFVGGGGIYFSICNGRYEEEYLNDANRHLMCVYKALKDVESWEETVKTLYATEKSKEIFEEARKVFQLPVTSSVIKDKAKYIKIAVDTYIAYMQSFNVKGISYSSAKNSRKYCRGVKNSIPKVLERLKTQPKLSCLPIVKLLDKTEIVDDAATQLFLDPPYVGMYRSMGDSYKVEMRSLKEHIEMCHKIKGIKAAVVLCGYRSEIEGVPTIYDAMLGEGWHCFKLADTYKKCAGVVKNGKKTACTEYVWTNRVPERAKYRISMVDYKENLTMEQYWQSVKKKCIEGVVPKSHIKEYCATYKDVYGKDLMEEV